MSPRTGRPTENPKKIRLEIRMSEKEALDLQECAETLKITKTDVINKGIQMVKKSIKK